MNRVDFLSFRTGPAAALCRQLGIDLGACTGWDDFTATLVAHNNATDGGVVTAARGIDGVASAGERALLHAILHAGDFDWLADELAAGKAWYRLSSLSGAHALAAAACLARIG